MFKMMYLLLFRRITDALNALARGDATLAKSILIRAQKNAEELYIEGREQ